jgi:ATP-dependent Lhr-like helicase
VRAGRWSLVHRFGVLGQELPAQEVALRQARLLLTRYGVVSRLSLEREEGTWDWAAISRELQRLEMRGEVRRGYFVAGFPGAQFALPEAVERLRQGGAAGGPSAAGEQPVQDELIVMNAADPANTWAGGSGASALAFARLPSTWVVLEAGLPLLVAEDSGTRIRTRPGCDEYRLRESLRLLLEHLGSFQQRVRVETWDGIPVGGSPAMLVLESLGFYADQPGMTWERAVAPAPGGGPLTDQGELR